MNSKEINRHSPEGRLLVAAVFTLISSGPEETKDKDPDEVIALLETAADALENFKM